MRKISDWGNYPVIEAEVSGFDSVEQLRGLLQGAEGPVIAYGNGRSYGDASLQNRVLLTRRFNKFLSFDEATGELCCQSGVLLGDILDVFVPRGWFLPVTPGTKLITVGGAVAADVHGKNHHQAGSFGKHVLSLEVMRNDGTVVACSPETHADFFKLTVGGMGLTGVILNVTFRLKRIETAFVRQETVKAGNLNEIMDCFEASDMWTYSVAWIDCLAKGDALGRSIMMRGEHASINDLAGTPYRDQPLRPKKPMGLDVPFTLPNFALNKWTVAVFNSLYYQKFRAGTHASICSYDSFFYPLDAIGHWNRIYGRRGFTQYQFVLPKSTGREGMQRILSRISESGLGSFLAVLKLFGKQDGFMSFPMEGYTLALDFPVSHRTFALFKELDEMVAEYGGRLYLAKDSRMDAVFFDRTYPNAAAFKEVIGMLNEENAPMASKQSERLGITG